MLALLLGGAIALTLVLGLLFTAGAIRVATRMGFVDRPGGHKSHRAIVPYGGGTAIFLAGWLPAAAAVLFAVLASQAWIVQTFGENARVYLGGLHDRAAQGLIILAGALVLHVLGLIDDVKPLSAAPKLIVILAVSVLVATWGHVRIGAAWGPAVSCTLTVAWLIVIINAFNFLDNMDGLSAGVAWICLAFFAICGLMAEQVLVPALACVFLGAIGGFWAFNFPPARIFMGDAGSLVIGYVIGVVSIMTTYYESGSTSARPYALAMPLVILAIPLYDFASVVLIRIAEGRNPLRGDQRHFSHRLVDRGLSRRFAVMTIYLATATTGLAGTLLPGADLRQTVTIGIIVLMVLAIIAILESPLRKDA